MYTLIFKSYDNWSAMVGRLLKHTGSFPLWLSLLLRPKSETKA